MSGAKVNGVTFGTIAKINGVAKAAIAKVDGIPMTVPMAAFSITVQTTTTPQDFKLYLAGASSLRVTWGDTNEDTYTGSDGIKTHSYATPGTYTITFVSGTATRIAFGGDTGSGCTPTLVKSVVTPVADWLGLTSSKYMFGYCTNLTSWCANFFDAASAAITNTERMFRGGKMNEDLSAWDMSANTFMRGMFQDSTFNGNIGAWDVSHVTNTASMFYGDAVFNNGGSDSIKNWNTSAVTLMSYMFCNDPAFNQPIGSWNTGAVTMMDYMFSCSGAGAFNQDLSGWDIADVTTFNFFLYKSAFNKTNYDLLLVAWAAQAVQSSVPFHAGYAHYSAGAPTTARSYLTGTKLWTITDGGTP